MTNDPSETDELGGGPTRVCAYCGHNEDDHIDLEAELPGRTARRGYCETCEEWHDFEPVPTD